MIRVMNDQLLRAAELLDNDCSHSYVPLYLHSSGAGGRKLPPALADPVFTQFRISRATFVQER